MLVVLLLTLIFPKISPQDGSWCDSDECYTKYHKQIESYKDQFRPFSELIQNLQQLNNSLGNLSLELQVSPGKSWIDDINVAKNLRKKIAISDLPTESDIKKIKKQIDDWDSFIKSVNKSENDILNIPYSTAEEINFIESLLKDKKEEHCLKEFDEELNKLFATIANFLKFQELVPKLKEILEEAENNRRKAQDILDDTNNILKKGEELEKTRKLAKKTLDEAEKLEMLKKQISAATEKEDLTQNNINELIKKNDVNFQKLLKKYRTSKYEVLLDNLQATYEELYELTGGEPVDISENNKDIKMYSECLDCYQEFLSKCNKNILLSKQCSEKIQECQDV